MASSARILISLLQDSRIFMFFSSRLFSLSLQKTVGQIVSRVSSNTSFHLSFSPSNSIIILRLHPRHGAIAPNIRVLSLLLRTKLDAQRCIVKALSSIHQEAAGHVMSWVSSTATSVAIPLPHPIPLSFSVNPALKPISLLKGYHAHNISLFPI